MNDCHNFLLVVDEDDLSVLVSILLPKRQDNSLVARLIQSPGVPGSSIAVADIFP